MLKDRYNLVLVKPEGFQHLTVFADVARLLQASLRSLGHTCDAHVNYFDHHAINILLGYQMVNIDDNLRRSPYIVYQLEQLTPGDPRFNRKWLDLISIARAVWEYSTANLDFLKSNGLEGAKHLPLGFHPDLATIPQGIEDVDILHYGSMNERRRVILTELQRHCRVVHLHGTYGQERDAAIARSKIVINIHLDDADPRFEQVRIAYLLNNSRFVISEPAADNPYGQMVVTSPYEQIVQTCRRYLQDDARRRELSQTSGKLFQTMPMVELLRSVLE